MEREHQQSHTESEESATHVRPYRPDGVGDARPDRYPRSESGLYVASPIKEWVRGVQICEVVGKYVELDRRGRGHCPWGQNHTHNDAKPSFQVFDRDQRFYCFRERIGGDAFSFLCRYFDADAREVLRLVRSGRY
jgi:CHC2 zinc finger